MLHAEVAEIRNKTFIPHDGALGAECSPAMRDAACRDLVECTRRIAAGALQKIPCPFEFALRRTLCPESEVMATSLAELAKRVMSVQIQKDGLLATGGPRASTGSLHR